jgi:hypothetical protein
MKKVRWEKTQIKTEEQKKAEEERERVLMASIDWHDFVVVETIDFDDEEKLPAPIADPNKVEKTPSTTTGLHFSHFVFYTIISLFFICIMYTLYVYIYIYLMCYIHK